MTSARTYLLLLLGIVALVGTSGGLGYYFFAILPEKQAETPPPETMLLAALRDDTSNTNTNQKSADTQIGDNETPTDDADQAPSAWSIGTSSRERRFGFKAPASRPPIVAVAADTVVMDVPRNTARRLSAGAPMDIPPPYFEELCEDYMGPFDISANGAGLEVLPGGGRITLHIQREHVDLDVSENIECGAEGDRHKIGDLDCELDVTIDLPGDAGMGAPGPAPGGAGSGPTPFNRWHQGGKKIANNSPRRDRGTGDAADALDAVSHYAMGTDPSLWFTDVNGYPIVQCPDLFPGVNLDCYAERNRLEFIYTVSPDGDPSALRMAFDGAQTAGIDPFGNIVAELGSGKIIQEAPRAFRIDDNNMPTPINARFKENGSAIQLELLADENAARDLSPSGPQLDLLSYLGGEASDGAFAMAVDHKGFTYVCGATTSRRFAGKTPDPKRFANDVDIFVTTFRNSDGHPVFTTYLGGSAEDRALGMTVAPDGTIYLCGETLSHDFPVMNTPVAPPTGQDWDAFITALTPEGDIKTSIRWGGRGEDHAQAIAIEKNGTVLVAGDTTSADLADASLIGPGGGRDAFVIRMMPDGDLAAVRMGGRGDDAAYGLALGTEGRIVIGGETSSSDFPIEDAWQSTPGGGVDAFMAMLNPADFSLLRASYIGAENDDRAYGVATDSSGYAYLAGETASLDLTLVHPLQSAFGGGLWDAFICKFPPEASTPLYATYAGGSGDDRALAVIPNAIGEATIAGETSSTNLPVMNAIQETHGGGLWDGFALTVGIGGSNLVACSYIGGNQADHVYGAAMETGRRILLCGETTSTNLTTINAIQSRFAGGDRDGFLAGISPPPNPGPELAFVPGDNQPNGPNYGFFISRFETTNDEFVRFLNDAQIHTNDYRGTNLFFDGEGNIWFNSEMQPERDEVFSIANSRIDYHSDFPIGSRYTVTSRPSKTGNAYTNHPVTGVSWYGAVKYCNWLTIDTGRGAGERCFREGTHALDWAPITCAETNWARGVFTPDERAELLEYSGYRLPMDNCATSSDWDQVSFLVSNAEFVNFLNGIEKPASDSRNANVFIDSNGSAWFNIAMHAGRDELFDRSVSHILFNAANPRGARFSVAPEDATRAVNGVSPYGAMKYCNWLSLRDGIPEDQLAYREGSWQEDWAPATCGIVQWRENRFGPEDYQRWIENVKGYRLPIQTVEPDPEPDQKYDGMKSWPNAFNEFYAAAAWNGKSNVLYAFGRDEVNPLDANYLGALRGNVQDTMPVGYFNGEQRNGTLRTHTNENAYGIYDLSGNVAEWMMDPGLSGTSSNRAAYGGSWRFAMPPVTARRYIPPYFTDGFGGFRPVVSAEATPASPYVVRIPYRLCLCPCGIGDEAAQHVIEKTTDEEGKAEEAGPVSTARQPGERLLPPEGDDDDDDQGGGFYNPEGDDDDDQGGGSVGDDDDDDDDDQGGDDDDDDDDEPVVSKSYV